MRFGVRDFSPAFDSGLQPAASWKKAANELAAEKRD